MITAKPVIDEQLLLQEIIETQKNEIPYQSFDSTLKHKLLCYQAFQNLLNKFPQEMTDYLLNNSRTGGFQCKVFQEYISLLEKELPFVYKKNKTRYVVKSLLDENLNLFNGISEFESVISSKLEIKNETKEFYIGGRAAKVSQPYFIGKLVYLIDKDTKECLMSKVIDYSFFKIKLAGVNPERSVIVTHLRIPPHYQMGGMVHVNRVRKKIVDNAKNYKNL